MEFEKRINFFAGPNGSGKTRYLGMLAKETIESNSLSIAISNTSFTRLPRARKNFQILRVTPLGVRKTFSENFKKYFLSDYNDAFYMPELLKTLGFYAEIEINILPGINEDLESIKSFADGEDYEELVAAMHAVLSKEGYRFRISDGVNSFERSLRDRVRIIFKYLDDLQHARLISTYQLFFHHIDRGAESFNNLSSGEQTLISTFLFIKSKVNNVESIFIDEPENSLHPSWQRIYIEMLHMALGYSEAKLFLATHSPVLMSGAISSHGEFVDVYKMVDGCPLYLEFEGGGGADSIEEILWEVFDTVTPVNHFLSVEVSEILQKLSNSYIGYEDAQRRIEKFLSRSYDVKQKRILIKILNNLNDFMPGVKNES